MKEDEKSVDFFSEAEAREMLSSLPITSEEDPRRNTDPATSTYFDYDDRVRVYNLEEATKNIHSYWTKPSTWETYKRCRIEESAWGKQLNFAKKYQYSDGSGGMRGFKVVRLGEDRFLFYGSDVQQWKSWK
ncbi:MAG: hypothetical protein OEZ25_05370 [Candidatus Bathyarchaeota archaeon]|nr:hypothetical protein [Candidatus Bathyarchaeota archaeon]